VTPFTVSETFLEFQDMGFSPDFLLKAGELGSLFEKPLPELKLTRFTPWKHQLTAYQRAYYLPGYFLALDMGTGKTKVAIDLIMNRGHKRILVVCPYSCIDVWPKELAKHCILPYRYYIPPVAKTSSTKIAEKIQSFMQSSGDKIISVVIVNYDVMWRDKLADVLLHTPWDLVIADESDKIKAPTGVFSKFMQRFADVPYRLALTGTPAPNNVLDLFGQCRFIDPGIYGSVYSRFEEKYVVKETEPYPHYTGWKNLEEFTRRFSMISYQVHRREVLELPPVTSEYRYCKFKDYSPYHELKKEFITWVQNAVEVKGDNALVRLLRLHELTSGFARYPAGIVQWDTAKLELFKETVELLPHDEPFTVFCLFEPDVRAVKGILQDMGKKVAELSGRVKELEDACYPSWANALVAQIQSGGRGIDLTCSCYNIYYSIGFSGGDFEQSLARTDRYGQTRPVTNYFLCVKNTVDEYIYNCLENKRDARDTILSLARNGTF